jgi:hypothetical protein
VIKNILDLLPIIDHYTVPCAILKGSQAFTSKRRWSWPCNDRDLWIIYKKTKTKNKIKSEKRSVIASSSSSSHSCKTFHDGTGVCKMVCCTVIEQISYDCEKVTVRAVTVMVPCPSILIGWEVISRYAIGRVDFLSAVPVLCAVIFHTHTKPALNGNITSARQLFQIYLCLVGKLSSATILENTMAYLRLLFLFSWRFSSCYLWRDWRCCSTLKRYVIWLITVRKLIENHYVNNTSSSSLWCKGLATFQDGAGNW